MGTGCCSEIPSSAASSRSKSPRAPRWKSFGATATASYASADQYELFGIVEDREALRGFKAAHQITELKGDFRFRHLVMLASTEALEALKRHLKNVTGKTSGSPEAPYLLLSDPVEQYLMLTGMTHFIGMEFAHLRRLQLHIETYITAGFEFASAAREGDRIVAIAIADNRGFEHVIRGDMRNMKMTSAQCSPSWRASSPSAIPTSSKDTIFFARISNTWSIARAALASSSRSDAMAA